MTKPPPFGVSKETLEAISSPPGTDAKKRKFDTIKDGESAPTSDGSDISTDDCSKMTPGEMEADLQNMAAALEEKKKA